LKRFGVLVREYDLERVGVTPMIFTMLFDLIRRLALALVICYLGRYPILFILAFNYTTLFYVMFVLYHMPIKEPTEQARSIFNELTILVVNYHLICMTDFVFSTKAQSWVGNSLVALILLDFVVNIYLSIHKPGLKLIPYIKRFYFRHKYGLKKNTGGKVQEGKEKDEEPASNLKRRKVVENEE
jgi:hypothetical protein